MILGLLFSLATAASYLTLSIYLSRSISADSQSQALLASAPLAISALLSFGNAALIHFGKRLDFFAKAFPVIFISMWIILGVLRNAL